MRKLLLPLLWALALVALPIYILLTGNAAAEVVLKYAVYGYASLVLAYAASNAITIYMATRLLGEDFGEKAHKSVMRGYKTIREASLARYLLTPAIGLLSTVILQFIGLQVLSALVAVAIVVVVLTRSAKVLYAEKYGDTFPRQSGTRTGVGAGWPAS